MKSMNRVFMILVKNIVEDLKNLLEGMKTFV